MSDLETTRSKLEAMLEALSAMPELAVNEAMARISEIVELAGANVLALEGEGQFEDAATVYEIVAKAFETAAQKVPEEDRQRVVWLGGYWSFKASTMRLIAESETELTPPPLSYAEQHRGRAIDRLALKMQHQGLAPAGDESRSSSVVSLQQAMDLLKDELEGGRETTVRAAPPTDWTEKTESKAQKFSPKKPPPR
jgi:hypothetical protein